MVRRTFLTQMSMADGGALAEKAALAAVPHGEAPGRGRGRGATP